MGHQEWKRIALHRSYVAGFEIDDLCTALLDRCEIANLWGHLGQQRHPGTYGKLTPHPFLQINHTAGRIICSCTFVTG